MTNNYDHPHSTRILNPMPFQRTFIKMAVSEKGDGTNSSPPRPCSRRRVSDHAQLDRSCVKHSTRFQRTSRGQGDRRKSAPETWAGKPRADPAGSADLRARVRGPPLRAHGGLADELRGRRWRPLGRLGAPQGREAGACFPAGPLRRGHAEDLEVEDLSLGRHGRSAADAAASGGWSVGRARGSY